MGMCKCWVCDKRERGYLLLHVLANKKSMDDKFKSREEQEDLRKMSRPKSEEKE